MKKSSQLYPPTTNPHVHLIAVLFAVLKLPAVLPESSKANSWRQRESLGLRMCLNDNLNKIAFIMRGFLQSSVVEAGSFGVRVMTV
jgi:hypothetical protein